MKNIHIIQTNKPSRLYTNHGQLHLDSTVQKSYGHTIDQHIYITSDEIKARDWCLLDHNVGQSTGYSVLKCLKADVENGEYLFQDKDGDKFITGRCEKIILTTDQDLIKDGVQEINDEFLEWFIKNPSCEKVEIFYEFPQPSKYKIIIPQEENIVNKLLYCKIEDLKLYVKKEFPKHKPSKKGFYITDYNGHFENSIVEWFGEVDNDGWCFVSSSGGVIDKKITWFMEELIIPKEEPKREDETLEDIVSDYDVMSNIRYGDNVGKRIKIKATIKSINLEEHKQSVQEYEQQGLEKHFKASPEYLNCKCSNPIFDYINGICRICSKSITHLVENLYFEDETLEEFIKNHHKNEPYWTVTEKEIAARNIKIGVEWQQERSYSEEEVEQIARFGFNAGRRVELKAVDLDFTFEKWFEQFKKKK
jgi:hypothetical protein